MEHEYVVIGAGFAGLHCARLLAEAGSQVTVLEQRPTVMAGASRSNFARIHHGWHFPGSPATARECVDSAFSFLADYGDLLLPGPRGWCALVTDSMTGEDRWFADAERLHEHYTAAVSSAPAGFGPPEEFFAPLPRSRWQQYLDPRRIVAAASTLEPFVDLRALAQRVTARATGHRRVRVLTGQHVESATPTGDGYELRVTGYDGRARVVRTRHVLNASWLSRHRLDSMIAPQPPVTYRLKSWLRIELPPNLRALPSLLLVHGPYCTFTNLGDGTGLLDHAPVSNQPAVRGAVPRSWQRALDDDLPAQEEHRRRAGILAGAAAFVPDLATARPPAVHSGALYHPGETHDDTDPRSAIHHRQGTGLTTIAPGWISLDSGKLSWIPHHARHVLAATRADARHLSPSG